MTTRASAQAQQSADTQAELPVHSRLVQKAQTVNGGWGKLVVRAWCDPTLSPNAASHPAHSTDSVEEPKLL